MYQTEIAFYDWTITKTEEHVEEYGCSYSDGCPCCTCDDDVVSAITMVRPRYSRSTKRIVQDYRTEWVCSAHADASHWQIGDTSHRFKGGTSQRLAGGTSRSLVCSLNFSKSLFLNTYHTSSKNIQILGKPNFYNFSDFGGIQNKV